MSPRAKSVVSQLSASWKQHVVPPEELPMPVSAAAFLKAPAPLPTWLVPALIERGKITLIGGVPGSGKTALVLKAAVEAAIAGHRVLLVALEGSKFALQKKLELNGLTARHAANIDIFYGTPVDLSTEGWQAHFAKLIPAYALVVLDTLADVQSADLLDARAIGEWLSWLRDTVVHPTGLSVVIVAHVPKAAGSREAAPILADVFGSQVIGGKLDNAFMCRDLKERGKNADVTGEEAHTPLKELHNVKMREGELLPPRVGRIVGVPTGQRAENGWPISVGVWTWEGQTPAQIKAGQRFEKDSQRILLALEALGEKGIPPTSANELWKAAGGKKDAFLDCFKRMLANGFIREEGGFLRGPARRTPPDEPVSAGSRKTGTDAPEPTPPGTTGSRRFPGGSRRRTGAVPGGSR